MLKEKHDVAQFIYEELQLAPWHLTGEFIDVHKKSEGSGMMQLSGLGDPSGFGEGFSFLRKVDNKPAKATAAANSALNDHVKKITGTEDDLRKLTMKEMAEILRKFGNMGDKEIAALKRWDRVYVIRYVALRISSSAYKTELTFAIHPSLTQRDLNARRFGSCWCWPRTFW